VRVRVRNTFDQTYILYRYYIYIYIYIYCGEGLRFKWGVWYLDKSGFEVGLKWV
jgi:hypothetical protein